VAKLALWALATALGSTAVPAAAAPPPAVPLPAETIAALRDYKAEGGDLSALLQKTAPSLAATWLALDAKASIDKGAPIEQTLGAHLSEQLDAKGAGLPMVVYHKEDGRLPGAFIVARYRKVAPLQIIYRLADRSANIKHPLMDQFLDLGPWQNASDTLWGAGATVRRHSALLAFRMPFGAGLFGLRDSYAVEDMETVMLPSGIAVLTYSSRPIAADEKQRLAKFKDKKDKERTLDDSYFEAGEYRLSSMLIPEKDPAGHYNTVHVYFVRIMPNLKPGSTLSGSGALAQWMFKRGAQDALIAPVQMIREEIERVVGK
jgi:hypothetical protein